MYPVNTVLRWKDVVYRLIYRDEESVWLFPIENRAPSCMNRNLNIMIFSDSPIRVHLLKLQIHMLILICGNLQNQKADTERKI